MTTSAGYELARTAALGGRSQAGHGTAVIMARGVTAWLRARASLPAPSSSSPPPPLPRPGGTTAVPGGPAVPVLASMTRSALAARHNPPVTRERQR